MDRQYIQDNEVIERYLSGALTAAEEQAFEEAYLGDPELLDQVQAAERLREGIKELDGAGRLERLRAPARWRHWLASPQYAAAASVLLAVTLGFSAVLYRENLALRQDDLLRGSATMRLVGLDGVRGGNGPELSAPAPDELTVLQLDAGIVAYDTYRGVLTRGAGAQSETIWNRADLMARSDGTILIGPVPARALLPGSYVARLDGRMNAWPAERFDEIGRTDFTVVPRD
ncbi:MAG TPA: hypothetical protein VIQ99_08905 [Gammaproteobacteria bacterium]